ncbi:hypothetical protein OZX73_04250 [Bifidobacterium sp. ESL0775]|uniref:hypothetical protein n=1 Tax=Bifidobacterium sp. ESL0775 TaxID=2983230 RepID=UPI0023F8B10F|nr:hypothetical protein [Bifidobacterium sp. ESL0775]WEV68521.1 hypothetical protein OZX73_04250 [Bifidobacterium sp. ESL0775]
MTKRNGRAWARLMALALAAALTMTAAACGSGQQDSETTSIDTSKVPESSVVAKSDVVIFTPSDGISISSHTPLNKWAKFVPALTKALTSAGFASKNITTKTDANLVKQSDDIQDYVVNQLSSSSSDTDRHTMLIVAPATDENAGNAQYGDYVTNPLDAPDSDTDNPSDGKSATESSGDTSSTQTNDDQQPGTQNEEKDTETAAAKKRLTESLKLARKAGAHTAVLANPIAGFTPDFFVSMSTPRQIGTLQARQLVSKLALEKTTANHPKSIEVMIPLSEDQTDSDTSKDFATEAFKGIWNVLGPYFKDGRAISPSKTLNGVSTEKDWQAVSFKASKTTEVRDELDTRLNGTSKSAQPHHVDGIIAMNDFVSSAVVDGLTSLKYTGSAADINPEIEVSGIVGTLTGKHNLNRQAVPKPKDDKTGSTQEDTEPETDNDGNMAWPIVTGYGSYVDMIPHVVNGKQWMTGMEDIQKLSRDIASVAGAIEAGKPAAGPSYVKSLTIGGKQTNVIHEKPMAISAGNLKKTLIEPGYISLADAGL